MNVLIVGSGGREHALAWKLRQSKLLDELYIAPGNAGTLLSGHNVAIDPDDFKGLRNLIHEKKIQMVVVGPEVPLVKGLHDYLLDDFELNDITVIGPVQKGAMLEGSKDFAKAFMTKYNIPTAAYKTFDASFREEAIEFLEDLKPPFVLKADGLAAGKGVLICESLDEAKKELEEMFDGKFGEASNKVVIEEFLQGTELSVFVLADGDSYVLLPSAKDYKRIGEGDTGLNTGGMGSISPVPFADAKFMKKIITRIIEPTISGLIIEKIKYQGFIFFGLINVAGNPYVIEYNVRMGDPEAESVIPRIKSDLLELFIAAGEQRLANYRIETDEKASASVMMVSGGYPGAYESGKPIRGLETVDNSLIFHAGTKVDPDTGHIITNGGRVIAVTSMGDSIQEALDQSYKSTQLIDFDQVYWRKDLGKDLIEK